MPVPQFARAPFALAIAVTVATAPTAFADRKSAAPIEYAGQGSVPQANSGAQHDPWRGPVTQTSSKALPSSRTQIDFTYPGSTPSRGGAMAQYASVETAPRAATPAPQNSAWPNDVSTTGPRQLTLGKTNPALTPVATQPSKPIQPDFLSASPEEKGLASWYGEDFHGNLTANGETFDMNAMTAAHRTLPLPSLVQVINQRNGKEIVVRVNDRGPFEDDRIIDLSQKAASLLGFTDDGTAPVIVKYLGPAPKVDAAPEKDPSPVLVADLEPIPEQQAPRIIKAAKPRPNLYGEMLNDGIEPSLGIPDPGQKVATPARLTPPNPVIQAAIPSAEPELLGDAAPTMTRRPEAIQASLSPVRTPKMQSSSPKIFLQVGAFADISNAQGMNAQVGRQYPVDIESVRLNGADYFRVLVGPFSNRQDAELAKYQLGDRGIKDGFVVLR